MDVRELNQKMLTQKLKQEPKAQRCRNALLEAKEAAILMPDSARKPGFYWVRFRTFQGATIAQYSIAPGGVGYWIITGSDVELNPNEIEVISERITLPGDGSKSATGVWR